MILKESEIDPDIIVPILGEPYKSPDKLLTATGSTIYFLRSIKQSDGRPVSLKREQMKAIFQRYEKGLLLMFTGNNYQNAIPLTYEEIQNLELSNYEEKREYNTGLFMNVLKSLSSFIPVRWLYNAFAFRNRETRLALSTAEYRIQLYTSYSSLKSQNTYFSQLGLGKRFELLVNK